MKKLLLTLATCTFFFLFHAQKYCMVDEKGNVQPHTENRFAHSRPKGNAEGERKALYAQGRFCREHVQFWFNTGEFVLEEL